MIQRLKQLGIDAFFRTAVDDAVSSRLDAASRAARIRTAAVGDVIGRYVDRIRHRSRKADSRARSSGHNKPEAFWMFAQSDPSIAERRHLVYVEDCADHVLNFELAFRRLFASRHDAETDAVATADTTTTLNENLNETSNSGVIVDTAAAAEPEVLSGVDARQFAFEDATLLFWPPTPEDGFETVERHSADAHERLIARCRAT